MCYVLHVIMPEEPINSNPEQNQIEQTPSGFPRVEGDITLEKIDSKDIPLQNLEDKPIPEIQKLELGQGGIGGTSTAHQQYVKHIKEIESIMEKDITDIYIQMPPKRQQKLKKRGEETAVKINSILSKTKINIKKIIKLIKKWLSIIPGVNKFFLEQSSKIKADEILKKKQTW